MRTSSPSTWFVAQTQPQSETKAAANLARQGFEIYLPRYLKTVRHARRLNVVRAPLFPSYIFIKIDTEKQRWRAVNSTVGVVHLVGHHGVPAPLPGGVIDILKEREGADGFFEHCVFENRILKAGDRVRLLSGAFDSCLGIFEASTDNDRVTILLEMLGRKVRVAYRSEPDRTGLT